MSEQRDELQDRTPTEMLVAALEKFGENEPLDALLIHTDERGMICWTSTSGSTSKMIGMLEVTKQFLLRDLARGE